MLRHRACAPADVAVATAQVTGSRGECQTRYRPALRPHQVNGYQHVHLRRDLNHPPASRQARNRLAQPGGVAAFHWMRILLPPADSNSMTDSSSATGCGVISSTNTRLFPFVRRVGTPPSRFFSCV